MRREGGFSAPLLTIVIAVVMLAVAGVSFDLWRILNAHQQLVAVVDASAAAGAGGIDVDHLYSTGGNRPLLDPVIAVDRACRYLTDHLDAAPCPGPDAAVTASPDTVTVVARTNVSLSLFRLLLPPGTNTEVEVAARAIAAPVRLFAQER